MKTRSCLVLDGLLSGSLIAPEFISRGYRCFHLFSSSTMSFKTTSFRKEDFVETRQYDGNYPNLLSWVKSFSPEAVIAGTDIGVYLADRLNTDLGLLGNDSASTDFRRNKFHMGERVAEVGLNAARQFKSGNLDQIVDWARKINSYPLILKTLSGAGSTNVMNCRNEDEVVSAFRSTIGKFDVTGAFVDELLAQTFVDGTEYFLNTVSYQGQHCVTDIWRLSKIYSGQRVIPYCRDLLPASGPEQAAVVEYGKKVLTALELKNGASLMELKLSSSGPCLIEVNPRVAGSFIPDHASACTGYSQIQALGDIFSNPAKFLERSRADYATIRSGATVFLSAESEGFTLDAKKLDEISQLKSFWRIRVRYEPGTEAVKARCLTTIAAIVDLAHENPEQVTRDKNQLLAWNRLGILFLPMASLSVASSAAA